jgi:hypothetical protein
LRFYCDLSWLMRYIVTIITALSIVTTSAFAQIGGNNTYEFLNFVNSARVTALGGNVISVMDDDINLAYYNPSLYNPGMDNQLSLNYVNYFAGINYGSAGYAKHFDEIGTFGANIQYLDYGDFILADNTGEQLGTFTAGEYALNIGYGRPMDSLFYIGANVKAIYSSLEQYSSFGMAVDIAGTFYKKSSEFMATAVVKNAGVQFTTYTEGNKEPLPFEVQIGISKKLKHAPIRFTVIGENLQQWDLTYTDPNAQPEIDPLTNEEIPVKDPGFLDKFMRHIVVGGELLFGKNISVRSGFNYRRRKEMKLSARPGTVGITWGFGFRINKFHFGYGRAAYHLAGGTNHITITTRISDFKKKS